MKKITTYLFMFSILLGIVAFPQAKAVQAATILNPHVLTTGSESDLAQFSTYNIATDGTDLYRLNINKTGSVEIIMYSTDPGYISVEVHKKADGSDLPTYMGFPCTVDRNNQYTIHQYMKKGTYYLRFPQNTYRLQMNLYPSAPTTIKNGSTVAAYCDATVESEFDYKATKTGYITLNQKRLIETAAPMSVSFYNSKGKKITDVVSDHEIATKIVFPVEKGKTYKIKIKTLTVDGQQYYQMKLNFTAFTEKSGSKKSKAVSAKLKSNIKGIIYAEDSTSTADWYEINNPANQKLKITYSGNVTSGSINLTIYNSKGKQIGTYNLMPGEDGTISCNLKNTNGSSTLPKGNYYLKVTKSRKQTAGIYQVTVKKR